MSTVKTKISTEAVLSFLQSNFDASISEVSMLKGGEMSQAFAFVSNDQAYVIRVNKNKNAFSKDVFAAANFRTQYIPIPEIVETGAFDEAHSYAISKRAPGATVDTFTPEEYSALLSEMLAVLDSIHATDILDTSGYGSWDADGVGTYDSWREFILDVDVHTKDGKLFAESCLEKDAWDKLYGEMQRLSEYCPEDRYLLHGDYGGDNLVALGAKVTGVIDWQGSKYGDFLYDVAWLSFWSYKRDPDGAAEEFYRKMELSDFEERLLCYKLRIVLSSMSFYAFSQQQDKYDKVKARGLALL